MPLLEKTRNVVARVLHHEPSGADCLHQDAVGEDAQRLGLSKADYVALLRAKRHSLSGRG